MKSFILSIDVDVPATEAWRVVADYALDDTWRSEVVSMVPTPAGPLCVGTTTHEVAKVLGSTFTTPGEVTAVAPGRSFSFVAESDSVVVRGTRSVVPTGPRSCRVELDYELHAKGATRFAAPMLRTMFRRTARANLRRLRHLLYERNASARVRAA